MCSALTQVVRISGAETPTVLTQSNGIEFSKWIPRIQVCDLIHEPDNQYLD